MAAALPIPPVAISAAAPQGAFRGGLNDRILSIRYLKTGNMLSLQRAEAMSV
jgi:hypothetical protein